MANRRYVSGKIIDHGIDGEKFVHDYLWVCQTAKIADMCTENKDSKIYELREVRKKSSRKGGR